MSQLYSIVANSDIIQNFIASTAAPAAISLSGLNTPGVFESFIMGIFSFLTPCLLPLVPVYIMYLKTDMGAEESPENEISPAEAAILKRRRFRTGLLRAFQFVLGFTVVFVLLGLGASSVGQVLNQYRGIISRIAGVLIIFFGLSMLGVIKINALSKDYRRMRSTSAIGMGMAFAFGWTPCISPFLGSILAMTASVTEKFYEGAFLLFVYSAGLAIPFLLSYVFIELFEKYLGNLSKHSGTIAKVGAVIMIAFGLLLVFDQLNTVLAWFT